MKSKRDQKGAEAALNCTQIPGSERVYVTVVPSECPHVSDETEPECAGPHFPDNDSNPLRQAGTPLWKFTISLLCAYMTTGCCKLKCSGDLSEFTTFLPTAR